MSWLDSPLQWHGLRASRLLAADPIHGRGRVVSRLMLTVAAASLLVGVAAILLPNSVVVLALCGLVARGLYGLILGGEQ